MKKIFFIINNKDRAIDLQINCLKVETDDLHWKTKYKCVYINAYVV